MRIQPKKSNKRPVYITVAAVILVIIGLLVYLYITHEANDTAPRPQTITNSESEGNVDSGTDSEGQPSVRDNEDTQTKVENKTPIQYEGEQINDEPPVDDERFRIPEEE